MRCVGGEVSKRGLEPWKTIGAAERCGKDKVSELSSDSRQVGRACYDGGGSPRDDGTGQLPKIVGALRIAGGVALKGCFKCSNCRRKQLEMSWGLRRQFAGRCIARRAWLPDHLIRTSSLGALRLFGGVQPDRPLYNYLGSP